MFFKQALIPKLKDQDPNVVISVLAAIGEHAQVSFRETNIFYITRTVGLDKTILLPRVLELGKKLVYSAKF